MFRFIIYILFTMRYCVVYICSLDEFHYNKFLMHLSHHPQEIREDARRIFVKHTCFGSIYLCLFTRAVVMRLRLRAYHRVHIEIKSCALSSLSLSLFSKNKHTFASAHLATECARGRHSVCSRYERRMNVFLG